MNTSKIDDQFAINKYPEIIVTSESENFAAAIFEKSAVLQCEVVVLTPTFITKAKTVDRKKRIVVKLSLLQNLQDARSRRVFSSHDGGAFIASDHPWL